MKIKKEINEQIKSDIKNCRLSLTNAIICACNETGIDPAFDIQFTRTLMIHTTKTIKRKGGFSHYETETTLADRIAWCPNHPAVFHLGFSGRYVKASFDLTLDGLCIVLDEMKNVLRSL